MGEENNIEEEIEDVDDVKRLLDWLYTRELSWAVLVLTSFIGLIELLPEIKYYGESIIDKCLTFLLATTALILVGGCVFSIDRFARLTNAEGALESKLPKKMKNRLHNTMGPVHKIFLKIDEKGNGPYFKRWAVPLICSLFAIIWVIIIILKII